jgi:predicted RNA-binding protein with PUA-like domain
VNHWLIKSEPSVFGIEDLRASPGRRTHWDGVRNYQARNFLRDGMRRGDLAFFYHSNCDEPGIVGIVEVVREGYPDPTAFDPNDAHYDAASRRDAPRWFMVDVKLKRKTKRVIPLSELKKHGEKALAGFALLRRGNRLSVLPVSTGTSSSNSGDRTARAFTRVLHRALERVCAQSHSQTRRRFKDAQKCITRWKFECFYIYSTPFNRHGDYPWPLRRRHLRRRRLPSAKKLSAR